MPVPHHPPPPPSAQMSCSLSTGETEYRKLKAKERKEKASTYKPPDVVVHKERIVDTPNKKHKKVTICRTRRTSTPRKREIKGSPITITLPAEDCGSAKRMRAANAAEEGQPPSPPPRSSPRRKTNLFTNT